MKRLLALFAVTLFVGCATDEIDSSATQEVTSPTMVARKDGWNDLWVTSYLLFKGENCANCPAHTPTLSKAAIDARLAAMAANGNKAFRDIIPLASIEPFQGQHPYETDIFDIIKLFQARDLNLVLAFGCPLPSWMPRSACGVSNPNLPGVNWTDAETMAGIISGFITRLRDSGIDSNWLHKRLVIEPFNEVNATISGTLSIVIRLDNTVKSNLVAHDIFVPVLSSSIISGTATEYLDWYTAPNRYYTSSPRGAGAPNIHLYANPSDAVGCSTAACRWGNAWTRMKSVVGTLYSSLPDDVRHNLVVGEIGVSVYDRDGLNMSTQKNGFLSQLYNEPQFNLLTSHNFIWRYWRTFSGCPVTDYTCLAEDNFGYAGAQGGYDTSFQNYVMSSTYVPPYRTGQFADVNALFQIERGTTLPQGTAPALVNGSYHLDMQTDGNLVLYKGFVALWSLYANETPIFPPSCTTQAPCRAEFDKTGELVMYTSANAVYWHSSTRDTGALLQFSSAAPFIRIVGTNTKPVYTGAYLNAPTATDPWIQYVRPATGTVTIISKNGVIPFGNGFTLSMGSDGNLVIYKGSTAAWSLFSQKLFNVPDCSGTNNCSLLWQSDGNLVAYRNSVPYWASGTTTGQKLVLTGQGPTMMLVDSSNRPVWQTVVK